MAANDWQLLSVPQRGLTTPRVIYPINSFDSLKVERKRKKKEKKKRNLEREREIEANEKFAEILRESVFFHFYGLPFLINLWGKWRFLHRFNSAFQHSPVLPLFFPLPFSSPLFFPHFHCNLLLSIKGFHPERGLIEGLLRFSLIRIKMEGKKHVGAESESESSSSRTTDPFGSKHSSYSSTTGIFGSIFAPSSKVCTTLPFILIRVLFLFFVFLHGLRFCLFLFRC